VALFMGLTLSAEELIKDRKILKRESFLNLSRLSYLLSKMSILIVISAIQTFCFVIIANWVLEINNMYFTTWLVLFSVSVFANILGLIISSAFNSAVTVYILIPILIIPQLILSGVIINFDQFNYRVSSDKHIPAMGDVMVSRWGYEALAVDQFVNNDYQKVFYQYEREIALSRYKKDLYISELEKQLGNVENNIDDTTDTKLIASVDRSLRILKNELGKERDKFKSANPFPEYVRLSRQNFDRDTYIGARQFLGDLKQYYIRRTNKWLAERNTVFADFAKRPNGSDELEALRNANQNERLKDFVEKDDLGMPKYKVLNDGITRRVYPIYTKPNTTKWFSLNSDFYIPEKALLGQVYSTYWVNVVVIWLMTISLALILYFDWLKRIVDGVGNFKENRMYRRKGREEEKKK
jgi:ABC-2 family transporter